MACSVLELSGRSRCLSPSPAPRDANEEACCTADRRNGQMPLPAAHRAHSPHCSSVPRLPGDGVRSLSAPRPAAPSWGSESCLPGYLLGAPAPLSQPRSPLRTHSPVGQGPAPFSDVEGEGAPGSGTQLRPGLSPPLWPPHSDPPGTFWAQRPGRRSPVPPAPYRSA